MGAASKPSGWIYVTGTCIGRGLASPPALVLPWSCLQTAICIMCTRRQNSVIGALQFSPCCCGRKYKNNRFFFFSLCFCFGPPRHIFRAGRHAAAMPPRAGGGRDGCTYVLYAARTLTHTLSLTHTRIYTPGTKGRCNKGSNPFTSNDNKNEKWSRECDYYSVGRRGAGVSVRACVCVCV